MDILNNIFNAWFQIIPYDLIEGIIALVFIGEAILTLTQNWDTIL